MTLFGGMRLLWVDEDMPEYRRIKWNLATGKVEMTGQQIIKYGIGTRLKFGTWDAQTATVTHHAKQASASRWSRVRRWQAGMMAGWLAVFFSLTFILVLAAIWSIALIWVSKKQDFPIPVAMVFVFASIMPPGLGVGILRLRRGALLPRETLLCIDRPTYLKQVGAAAAISQLEMWLCSVVGVLIWWWLAAYEVFSPKVVLALAFSALLQPWFFGVGVWFVRFRSPLPLVAAYIVFVQVTVISTMATTFGPARAAQPVVLSVAAIFAILGLILTWDAYRRWLVTDFD